MAALTIPANGRIALYDALTHWCLRWCFIGWYQHNPADVLQQFVNSSDVIDETIVLPASSTGLAGNRVNAANDLRHRLTELGYDVAGDRHTFAQSQGAAWALQPEDRVLELWELWVLLADLTNIPAASYRGAKTIFNTVNLCRTFSR